VDAIGKVSPMIPESVLSLDEIDLSDPAFWERPWSQREGAFSLLRHQRPLAFFEEVDLTQTSAYINWATTSNKPGSVQVSPAPGSSCPASTTTWSPSAAPVGTKLPAPVNPTSTGSPSGSTGGMRSSRSKPAGRWPTCSARTWA